MKAKPNLTDLVFQALASRMRRRLLDLIKQNPGCCVNDLCEHFDVSRIAVMKQLNLLVHAQLAISKKVGRKRELYFNAAPIQLIYDRWTTEYSAFWASQAVDLKYRVEQGMVVGQGDHVETSSKKQSSKSPSKKKARVRK